jgi:hypothetical protein
MEGMQEWWDSIGSCLQLVRGVRFSRSRFQQLYSKRLFKSIGHPQHKPGVVKKISPIFVIYKLDEYEYIHMSVRTCCALVHSPIILFLSSRRFHYSFPMRTGAAALK